MKITEQDIIKERKKLKETSKILNETLKVLADDVYEDENALVEFKKMMWEDSSSFDKTEINQVTLSTEQEFEKFYRKQKYFHKLLKIKSKPYFASIVVKDEEEKLKTIYISLTYLKDNDLNNIIYDWRSPICSLYYDNEIGPYQYTAPGGIYEGELLRKRQYKIENQKLLGVFDNSLNIDDEVLQEVLSNDSNETMKNVVNTIQQEQNKVIRNLEDNNLIVQGIAGSGKTTVALHRIAYLLYQIKSLTSNNILIFSPNNIFTDYIKDVLPSLGEENTLQTTFNDYLSYYIKEYKEVESFTDFIARYYKKDTPNYELIKYKQSDEIIKDIDSYLNDFINNTKCIKDIIETEFHTVTKEQINNYIFNKYNRLPLFERIDEISKKLSFDFYEGKLNKKATFKKLIKDSLNIKKDIKEIYKNFYKSKYCKFKLSDTEINSFIKSKTIYYEDALLLSYIKGILEGFPYEANVKQVVIDEAQDYNLLQYIIISKIFKKADFTILGDVNQNINPYYKYKSLNILKDIFKENSTYIELLKTYRSSPEIINYTNKILNLNHVNAIRKTNNKPVILRKNINNLKESLLIDINNLQEKYKSIAIITKDDDTKDRLFELLKNDLKITKINTDTKNLKKDLIIISAYLAKGLEFDSVISYTEKNNDYHENEKNLLYVTCTRAQHELYIYEN